MESVKGEMGKGEKRGKERKREEGKGKEEE